MDKKIRTNVGIPLTHYKAGLLLAWLRSCSVASLASDLFQTGVEDTDKLEWIRENLEARAKDLDISPEELEARIYEEAGLDLGS